MSIRSVISVLAVSTNLSAKAFARWHQGGILIALRGIQLSGPPQVTVSWVLPLSWDVVAQVRSAEYP